MNKVLVAGLLFALTGFTASAQVTPNPDSQKPATLPAYPDDRQQTSSRIQDQQNVDADTPQKDRAPRLQQQTEQKDQYAQPDQEDQYPPKSRYNQNNRYNQHPQADEDQPYPQSPQYNPDRRTQPRSDRDYDRDRNNNSISSNLAKEDQGRYRDHRSEYQSQLEHALQQQPNLSGVQATYTNSTVELTGTVPTGKDKHQARMIAQDFANGRKIVDHIRVIGRGQK
jgi:hypothetical protein